MVTYTVYMKELSATSTWQDITHAVVEDKDIPVRKGFGSLSDAIDVGSVKLTVRMESLEAAALLHVSQKQILIQANGVNIFEGLSSDDADVDLNMNTDYVFAKLKFKPYSSTFGQAKVPEDTVWKDKKICDPSDTDNSLVHMLFGMIIENLPGELPDIVSPLFAITTIINNTKTLPLVMLEAGESVEDYLTDLLYQNGYSYWMELYTVIIVDPYAEGRLPSTHVPITDIVAKPKISQAPYIVEEKCVVRLGKIETYANETVYELNKDRYEDTGEPTHVALLEPNDYYPLDSDGAPTELEADYETERETDDIELVYAEGLSYECITRQIDPMDPSQTIPADIAFTKHEISPTSAILQVCNTLAVDVSLRNILVIAETAYYRNWSERYSDDETTATEEDEIDGIWMPDSMTARAFIKRYRAELKAEATHVSFQTHVALQPNTLITITGLPYQLLVRYVTKLESAFYEYECVAYLVSEVVTSNRIRVSPKRIPRDGRDGLDGGYREFEFAVNTSEDVAPTSGWQDTTPSVGEDEYLWMRNRWVEPDGTPGDWDEPVRIKGDEGEDAYYIEIFSSRGNFFRQGQVSTVLTVYVFRNGEDITDLYTDSDFRWSRSSDDPVSDEVWNQNHYSTGGKSITITPDDVDKRAVFNCELLSLL